jgi:hypothetical protein
VTTKTSSPRRVASRSSKTAGRRQRTPTRHILSPFARDAVGIGLVVVAGLAILATWFESAGPAGSVLSWLLRAAWGSAAVAFPIVGVYWGIVLLRDVLPEDRVRMFIGFVLLTLGLLGILSLLRGNPSMFAGCQPAIPSPVSGGVRSHLRRTRPARRSHLHGDAVLAGA